MDAEAMALSGPKYQNQPREKKYYFFLKRKRTQRPRPWRGPVGSWPGQSLSGSLLGPS
jgi:hypothetical protein